MARDKQEITSGDVAALAGAVGLPSPEEVAAQAKAAALAATRYADGSEIKSGDLVRFSKTEIPTGGRFSKEKPRVVSESPLPSDLDAEWQVVIVNDFREHPGYPVGLLAPKPFPGGHDLEGFVSTDEAAVSEGPGSTRMGRGWWAVGPALEKVE